MLIGDLEVDAMVQDLMGRAEWALIETINAGAAQVLDQAEVHVPKSGDFKPRPGDPHYPPYPLEESGRIEEATPGNPRAEIVFDHPAAAAQEVGEMVYVNPRGGKTVDWKAEHYTTPDTGAHYLEDALKSVTATLEVELAVQSRRAFGEIPGVKLPKSTVSTLGRREETAPAATGEIATLMHKEESAIANVPVSGFRVPPTTQ